MREDEQRRLGVLHEMGILDTPREERFDRLARIACQILDAPMGLVSFVDADRLWAKSRVGNDLDEIPRDVSFCTHTIRHGGPLVVEDASQEPRFRDNPLVVGEPRIRFYAGTSLRVRGQNIGALCVFDSEPRSLTQEEGRLLVDLGQIARDEVEDVASNAVAHRLRSIIAATPDAMVMADRMGQITEFNPAAERLLGYDRGQMRGRSLTVLMPERYRSAHEAGFERYLATGEPRVIGSRVELHALHKDGHEIPVELSLAASTSDEGLAFTGIMRDLTRRHELEEERVRARARELELQQAREFDRLKNQFINQASHELYTPLTPIALQVELLKQKLPEHRGDLIILERNVARLQAVVGQVMRVAQLQSRPTLHRQGVDLQDIAAKAVASFDDYVRTKGLTVDVSFAGPLAVDGDPGLLHDAIFNVVDNAIRQAPQGGRVTLRGERQEQILLRVVDSGPGIPRGNEERVFEAFYQGEAAKSGWGLGLFVAFTIVQRHGGTMRAQGGPAGAVEIRLPPARVTGGR